AYGGISRHPETRKAIVSNKMLQGVENNRISEKLDKFLFLRNTYKISHHNMGNLTINTSIL
ncbi:hypothetical protein HN873_066583, partial [Arachis hypogaea]